MRLERLLFRGAWTVFTSDHHVFITVLAMGPVSMVIHVSAMRDTLATTRVHSTKKTYVHSMKTLKVCVSKFFILDTSVSVAIF